VIDQCISGQRPESHAKTLNIYLILTRLAGTLLALAMLPPMAHYVRAAAYWIDRTFSAQPASQDLLLADSTAFSAGLKHQFVVVQRGAELHLTLTVTNISSANARLDYSSGARCDFGLTAQERPVWRRNEGLRFTQALEHETLAPGESLKYDAALPAGDEIAEVLDSGAAVCFAEHLLAEDPVIITVRLVEAED
jgi:hypothetical protein